MQIKWDKENDELLTLMYNQGDSDETIAKYFNSTVFAIAKHRTSIGLKKHSKSFSNHKQKVEPIIEQCNAFVGHYKVDGVNHFIELTDNENKSKQMAHKIVCDKGLKEITILKPYSKLVFQNIFEIKF